MFQKVKDKIKKAFTWVKTNVKKTIVGVLMALGVIGGVQYFGSTVINAPQTAQTTNGLVAYWTMNGEDINWSTGRFTDSSGTGNTGIAVSLSTTTSPVIGKSGQAIRSAGTPQYVYANDSSSLDLDSTNRVSISAWVKIENSGEIFLAGKGTDLAGSGCGEYSMWIRNGYLVLFSDDFCNWAAQSSSAFVTSNVWTFVTATYDGTNSNYYINGEYVDSKTSDAITTSGSGTFRVLHKIPNWGAEFQGGVDELRLYNRVLSADEIKKLYNAGHYVQTLPKTNLMGYYSFEDATGTVATDFSGNNNPGTLTNMDNSDWVTGRVGKALEFDGSATSEYVDLTSHLTDFEGLSTGAMSLWFKWDGTRTGNYLFNLVQGTSGYTDSTELFLGGYTGSYADESIAFIVRRSSLSQLQMYLRKGTTFYADNKWHHVVLVIDGSANTMYVDGVNESANITFGVGTAGTSEFTDINSADFLALGTTKFGGSTDSSFSFRGQMDEFRFYSSPLTQAQVTNIYNSSKYAQINTPQNNKITDGLVGYWTFNGADVDGTTIKDVSGNGNTGTATNGPVPAIGKVGQSYDFDGVDDYITIASPMFNPTEPFSISMWIRDATNSTAYVPFSVTDDSAGVPHVRVVCFSNYLGILTRNDSNASEYADSTGAACPNNDNWQHIVITSDGTTWGYYHDGVSYAETENIISGTYDDLDRSSIGNYYPGTGPTSYWDGNIDEVRVYNRALTSAEVTRLYNMGR